MPYGTSTTKVLTHQYWYMEAYADFGDCLAQVYSLGYIGTTESYTVSQGVQGWKLRLESNIQPEVVVVTNEVVVWDGNRMTVYPVAEFLSRYDYQEQGLSLQDAENRGIVTPEDVAAPAS